MIKNKVYNFVLPEKIELVPSRWWFKSIKEPTFDVTFVAYGSLVHATKIKNSELSKLPITGLRFTRCPKGTVIKKINT